MLRNKLNFRLGIEHLLYVSRHLSLGLLMFRVVGKSSSVARTMRTTTKGEGPTKLRISYVPIYGNFRMKT